jgi:hypothetical protein
MVLILKYYGQYIQFVIIPPDSRNKLAFPSKQWWGNLSSGAIYATFPYITDHSRFTCVLKEILCMMGYCKQLSLLQTRNKMC